MNNDEILKLMSRLKATMDENYKVKDLKSADEVLAIFTELESNPITKEVLEESKLLSLLVDICEHTKDNILFFCARNIIQKWRVRIGIGTTSNEPPLESEYSAINNVPTETSDKPIPSGDFIWNSSTRSSKNGLLISDKTELSRFACSLSKRFKNCTLSDAVAEFKAQQSIDFRNWVKKNNV